MKLKTFLICMTWIAVVSDYLLHPFYPQFFEARFGVTDPSQVGYYFAAICFMIMISFPFWAQVSKKVAELNILVFTQFAAGLLAICCYWTDSYTTFWAASLIMILFKGSYLLVYPYILKIISEKEHGHTIGLLSVVVHLGGILGAVLGGLTVDFIDAEYAFLIMAAGDFVLMGASIYLINSSRFETNKIVAAPKTEDSGFSPKNYILKIGLITLVLYFSDFLIRPFFSKYWESISMYDSKFISGTIYAIPGFVALLALWVNKIWGASIKANGIILALLLGMIGLMLQGTSVAVLVIVGRIIYGWAIFQGDVRFDMLLFQHSTPESYSTDYSKVHFFQNLGVLIASFSAGLLVDGHGLQIPFYVALLGVLVSLGTYCMFFSADVKTGFKQLVKT